MFGDPIPRNKGKRGRPAHMPTAENRRFVQMALACGREEEEIAGALRITPRTLNRHYFHELEGKRHARLRLDMKVLGAIVAQVEAGNVSAMSLLAKKIERMNKAELPDRMKPAKPPAEPRLGKKEERKLRAQTGHKETQWGSLLRH